MKKKFALGITLFGLYFIVDSLFQLYVKLLTPNYYSWYSTIFQALPGKIILLRYPLSIIFRIFELALAIGILRREEIFRKFAVLFSWFTISIFYWKHPFDAMSKHTQIVVKNIHPIAGSCQLTSPAYTNMIAWVSLWCVYAIDIGISALAIYYFTRPYIKEQFKR
ncbi:hypothetical protein KKD20_02425 [Patescibacteria group bacterium]|nr:hypothetical protein [Patescibacteria group bacterium]